MWTIVVFVSAGLKDKAVTGYILYRTLGDLMVSVSEQSPFSDNLK